ncbi:MAG TPA: hypothetical protein DCL62_01580 [Kandleria vitulina]|nr:hypothetical protein [Kandleria vitulina]
MKNEKHEQINLVSILKTRTLFVLMLEQTLMKFEKEHSDLMCGYDEYEPYWSLETEKSKILVNR